MTNMSIDGDDSLELANQLSPTLNMVIMITIIIKITRIQGFFFAGKSPIYVCQQVDNSFVG